LGRVCRVCSSCLLLDYEKMYSVGKKVSEIKKYAVEKNDDISYNSFARHFKKCSKNRRISNVGEKDKLIKTEINTTVSIIKNLNRNLEVCSQKIDSLLKEPSPNTELLRFLSETRMTIGELRSFMKEFNIKSLDEKEDIFNRILYCMKDFPINIIEEFERRWSEFSKK